MKVIDLMIGDWFHNNYTNENYQVWPAFFTQATNFGKRLDATFEDINIAPVPLTPEILEKNGWMYNNEDEKFFPQTWVGGGLMLQGADDCGYRIVVTSDYDDEDTNNTPFILLYVHELQQALRLRRIKKKIIL